MNAVAPTNPPTVKAKSHRAKIMLSLMLIMVAVMGWEYWVLTCHDKSLARLQAEVDRRKGLSLPLTRNDVATLLSGSPKTTSNDLAAVNTDFYSWSGLIYQRHISVEYDAAEAVVKVEDAYEIPRSMEELIQALSQKTPPPPTRKVTQEEVDAALAHAQESYLRTEDRLPDFGDSLRSVFDGLPEIKVSSVKGQLIWNSFHFSRKKCGLFAFRFTVPQAESVELDYVGWLNQIGWQSIAVNNNVITRSDPPAANATANPIARVTDWHKFDLESYVEAAGIGPLEHLQSGSRSLNQHGAEKSFIFWIYTGTHEPDRDFEFKTVLFSSPADKVPLRRGVLEVCEHIGLRTNISKIAATPDGVRDALRTLDIRYLRYPLYAATYDRLFGPILSLVPEVTMSTTPGEARWQKIEFPQGRCAVVRVRVPKSLSGKADLFGAILGAQPREFGWHCHDWQNAKCQVRVLQNASLGDPFPAPPNQLTLFSETTGVLEPGQEVALFCIELDESQPVHGPLFVTLTAVPHVEHNSFSARRRLQVDQPWSCAKLLGIEAPRPAEPPGCHVLGMHEETITHLLFSPDSRRLVSVGLHSDTRVWDVENHKLTSEFLDRKLNLAYDNAGTVFITPNSQNLLTFDTDQRSFSLWNLDERTQTSTRNVPGPPAEKLNAAAFGASPHQLAMAYQLHNSSGPFQPRARFVTCDLNNGQVTDTQMLVNREAGHMIYLPVGNLFAVGLTHQQVDPATQRRQIVSAVQLYSPDFSKMILELPMSSLPIERPEQVWNFVRLSHFGNNRRLAAIDGRGQLKVWDIGTWTELLSKRLEPKELTPFKAHSVFLFTDVSLAPDGDTVATTSPEENAVTRWNIADGQREPIWQTDEIEVTHVAHSPDGKWAATANTDGVIRLWKIAP